MVKVAVKSLLQATLKPRYGSNGVALGSGVFVAVEVDVLVAVFVGVRVGVLVDAHL